MKAIDLLDEYRVKQEEKKSLNTVSAYVSDVGQFNGFLMEKGKEFDGITSEDVNVYIEFMLARVNELTGELLKPKTINRKLVSIRKFIDYLNSNEKYEKKIFVEIELLKVQEQYYLEDLLSKCEFDRMVERTLQEKDIDSYVLFNTLYYTGTRVSELLQIKAESIKNDNLVVKGKGRKYREIILGDTIVEILNDYIEKNKIGPKNLLFNMTRQTVHNAIKYYAGQCRIKLARAHAHNFRHLCAFRLIENGATLEEVADFLGHTNINTTRIYTRKTKSELRKTLNRL